MIKFNFTSEILKMGSKNSSEDIIKKKTICDECKKKVNKLYSIKINKVERILCVDCKKKNNQ